MQPIRSTERANGAALAGSMIGLHGRLQESAHAEGIYNGVCRGYKDQHQAEYLREWPRLLAMRAKRDAMLRYTPTLARTLAAKFLDELAKFEAYMESLTEIKWAQYAPNVVCTQGKNTGLDAMLAGSSYTAATYMFLIGAVSYVSAPAAGDTMASHSNWTEAGGTNAPTYSGNRPTVSWSAAASGSKAPSSAPVFSITGTGTAKGVGIVFGSGASATKDNTGGSLWSAGLFTGGDQAVVNTNTVTVTYSTSL